MSYTVKSQTPLMLGENFIYPLTTADQVVVGAGTENERRLEVGGKVEADHAVNAENAVNAVNAESAVKADNADNASLLGGKAPIYYIQPRNLLDNSDFTNPVNQRGFLGGSSKDFDYTIDRWVLSGNITISDGYIAVKPYAYFLQRMLLDNITEEKLTLAYCLSDGTVRCGSVNADLSSGDPVIGISNGEAIVYVQKISDNTFQFVINPAQEISLTWAALYEGEYTADNLPPYVPKGYGAELIECMRYFQRIVGYDYSILSNGFWFTSTSFRTAMPISFPMRSKPAISMDLSRFQVVSSGGTQLAPLKVDLVNQSGSTVSLSIETTSNTQGLAGMLRASVSSQYSYIDLSADL